MVLTDGDWLWMSTPLPFWERVGMVRLGTEAYGKKGLHTVNILRSQSLEEGVEGGSYKV